MPGAEPARYTGLDGLRTGWLDWMEPWASYRSNVEELIDLGDSVVVLVRDYGRRDPDAPEIEQIGGAIWTVRDGKIARVEFYARRDEALAGAGLAE
jgi:ketosteroid isomerase-like protein